MHAGQPRRYAGPHLSTRHRSLIRRTSAYCMAALAALSVVVVILAPFVVAFLSLRSLRSRPPWCSAQTVQSNGTVNCATYCADGHSHNVDVGSVCMAAKWRGLFGAGGSPAICQESGSALECCCGPPRGYGAAARELCTWLYHGRPACPPPWVDSTCLRQKLRQVAAAEHYHVAELKESTLWRCLGELQLDGWADHAQRGAHTGGTRSAATQQQRRGEQAGGRHPGKASRSPSAAEAAAQQVRTILVARSGELRSLGAGAGHRHVEATTVWLCCIVKFQARLMPYWITWHLLLGVSHVLVYDNHETGKHESLGAEALRECLEPFIRAGLVTLIAFAGVGRQVRLTAP
jgi:hypothetical protein